MLGVDAVPPFHNCHVGLRRESRAYIPGSESSITCLLKASIDGPYSCEIAQGQPAVRLSAKPVHEYPIGRTPAFPRRCAGPAPAMWSSTEKPDKSGESDQQRVTGPIATLQAAELCASFAACSGSGHSKHSGQDKASESPRHCRRWPYQHSTLPRLSQIRGREMPFTRVPKTKRMPNRSSRKAGRDANILPGIDCELGTAPKTAQ